MRVVFLLYTLLAAQSTVAFAQCEDVLGAFMDAELLSHYATWLEGKAEHTFSPPRHLPQDWAWVAKIGEGEEATVHLIRSSSGEYRVHKEFKDTMASSPANNSYNLKKAADQGVPVARILEIDAGRGTLEQEYVKGFTVLQLLTPGIVPVLGRGDRDMIRKAFMRFEKRHRSRNPHLSLLQKNVMLDFKTGRFVLVDPH
jgi:hypothetical protein